MTAPCEKPKEAMKPISIQTSRYSCRPVKKIVATPASRAGSLTSELTRGRPARRHLESRVNTSLMISPVGCERKSRYTGGVSVIVLRIRLLWNYINSCADPQARRVCRGYPVASEENRWGAGHESP